MFKTIENPLTYILDTLGLIQGDTMYKIRHSSTKVIARGNTPDHYEILGVLGGQEYKFSLLPFIKDPVIFDIGGHIGTFSLYALNIYRTQKTRLHIFEPASDNYGYLSKNLAINPFPNATIRVRQAAVSSIDGSASLVKRHLNNAYTLLPSDGESQYDEKCETIALPGYCKREGVEHIDILKIDIEGGEYILLRGEPTVQFIKRNVDYLFMEVHDVPGQPEGIKWVKDIFKDSFDVLDETGKLLYMKHKRLKERRA